MTDAHPPGESQPARLAYPAAVLRDVEHPGFIAFLDLARWTAAAIVFVSHLRAPLFVGRGGLAPNERNLLQEAWYFVTGWHSEAVIVFFVLSGFLVGGLGSAKVALGRFDARAYAIDRISRIYMAFLPALLLTVVLDTVAMTYFSGVGLHDNTHPVFKANVPQLDFQANTDAATFFQNLALLPTMHPYGSNSPLWTIWLEFWFYGVFGLILCAALASKWLTKLCLLLLAAILTWYAGSSFMVYGGLWLVGVAAAFVPWRRIERPWVSTLLFCAALVASRIAIDGTRTDELMRIGKNYLVAIAFAWVLVSMRQTRSMMLLRAAPINRFMADFSYSLYLIHYPVMLFLLCVLHAVGFDGIATGYRPSEAAGLMAYGLTIVCVFVAAWGFSLLTERNTGWARRALRAALMPASVRIAPRRAR